MRDRAAGRGPGRLAWAVGVVLLSLSGWCHGAAWAVDQATAATKLVVQWVISAYADDVPKDGSLAVAMSMIGSLPFKDATPQDLKIAEGLMDKWLVDTVHHVALSRHDGASAAHS